MRLLDALHIPYRHYSYECREFVDARHTAEALNLAEEIARNSPYAVTRAKRSVNGGREMLLEEVLEWERSLFGECGESRDRKEGMTAFLEKRPRVFTGE